MAALKQLSESQIQRITSLARKCQYQESKNEGKLLSGADLVALSEVARPEYEELEHFIDSLSNEAQIELVALMWLGRGDANDSGQQWLTLLQTATTHQGPETTGYVSDKAAQLGEYLLEGLRKLHQQ